MTTEANDNGRKLTKTGMLFGTPEYMSPEQARGETPDHRVDVYAMGCILYQLVTGDVPFAGETFMAVLSQHLTAEPPEISAQVLARVGAPPALASVIARSLEKDRDVRYRTIAELANAVVDADGGHESGELVSIENQVAAARTRSGWRGSAVIEAVAPVQPPSAKSVATRTNRRALFLGIGVAVVATAVLTAVLVMGGSTSEDAAVESPPEPIGTSTPQPAIVGADVALDAGQAGVEAGTELPVDPSSTTQADKKPADKKPADKKPADKKPADKKPADKKPADKKPADKKPSDKKPADKKPGTKAGDVDLKGFPTP